jgi:hypothetical protein
MDNRVSGGCVTAEKGLGERGFGGWGEGGGYLLWIIGYLEVA